VIRNGKATDIPALIAFMQMGYERTHYARERNVHIDVAEAKKLFAVAAMRHGHLSLGATWFQVAETNGIITGLILGSLARVYVIGNKLMASDLFWTVNELAEPSDAMALMAGMIEWAKRSPECVEIRCGTTAIMGDPAKAGVLLRRAGMSPYGSIYRMEIGRGELCLAS